MIGEFKIVVLSVHIYTLPEHMHAHHILLAIFSTRLLGEQNY